LQKLGADFWTPWVNDDFERRNGYAEGSLGPIYGFQLRHFGGAYGNGIGGMTGSQSNITPNNVAPNYYGTGGFDQLKEMVNLLRLEPDSRRNLFSLWNPQQIGKMRIPPCHYTFQVYTEGDKLSGVLTQRSCDFPVGVPYNIAFYSALIYMLATETGYLPNEFVHHTIDSHIYVDQIPAVEEYLSRPERSCPKLTVKKAKNIDSYSMEDFELTDYNPDEVIKIPVAV
jgi:thymidylate synthase